MSTLESKLGEGHGLVSLIKECLADDPERRPTAHQAMDRLSDMVGDLRQPFLHMNRFQLEMSLTEKSAEAEANAREIAENKRRLEELKQENKELKV
ncbi:hypothetical protein GBAR_LOCUS1527, partial [Geodia barretti]